MSFRNAQETGRPVTIKDEGITLTSNVSSIDFAGTAVTGTNIGDAVTETVTGGGTGFTQLPATGSINGTNATFTFTQKPAYIVSDGVWYVENAGWTWSVLTATMTVPPQTGIWGFV